jgi:hypothetical protein
MADLLNGETGAADTGANQGQADAGIAQQTPADGQQAQPAARTADEQKAYDALTPELKQADDAKRAEEAKKAADGKEESKGAPEKYEDFKLPEGVQSDPADVAEFQGLAKELNLTQEQAQKLIDFEAKVSQKAADAAATNQKQAWVDHVDRLTTEFKADKEIGGAKLDESVALANLALKELGTPELIQRLKTSGMGCDVELGRLLVKAGALMKEAEPSGLGSGAASDAGPSGLQAMYTHPTSQPKK